MSTFRALIPLLASFGLLLVANGLFGTVISIRTKSEAFPETVIGVVLAAYFLGLLLSSFYASRLVASFGHIRAFAAFASIASSAALAHLLWVDPVFWGSLRFISGFCMGGMIIVTEGWINDRATNKNRGTILALYMITTYGSAGFGQLIMLLDSPTGFKLFLIVSILYSFALLPILTTQSKTPTPSSPHRPNIRKLYQVSPVGMIGSFVVGMVNSIYYALAPIYAISLGLNSNQTAIFIGLGIASGMLLQFPLGKLSDHIDRRWVLVFSGVMTAIVSSFLVFTEGQSLAWLYFLAICYGSVGFSMNAICVAHTNDLAPAHERTQTSSGLLMFYGIGAVIGPIMTSFFMQKNNQLVFGVIAIVTLVFAAYAFLRIIIRPRKGTHKRRFVAFTFQSPARKLVFSKRHYDTNINENTAENTAESIAENTKENTHDVDNAYRADEAPKSEGSPNEGAPNEESPNEKPKDVSHADTEDDDKDDDSNDNDNDNGNGNNAKTENEAPPNAKTD
ncbi:MFS transporter [Ostreibacterium oceani]|uniref:MFS transporter n=1 Tax=Ostreibacterium oceani TaxID=2654998 RepID=A0A6N7ESQ6_9GAMM|nr:MFS transporter [Ostreibacterium oceani]MPV85581.1 MFS transporter [Ostreibacterium oceani]